MSGPEPAGAAAPPLPGQPVPGEPPASILVVDDEPALAQLLARALSAEGYRVTTARDGREALDLAAARPPDLVLLDLDMPRLHGFEACRQLKQGPATRLVPVVILTGRDPSDARLRAWELGADEFLNKPFHQVELLARCRSLLRVKRLVDELDSAQDVVFAFARAVEAKCRYTLGHAARVGAYSLALAERVGLGGAERAVLRRGALLHDLGKIAIPDAILNKQGQLTDEEYRVVREHSARGARILEPLRSVREAVPLIRWHHERLDGTGYPDGLVGEAIPLGARILAVADVYDALASARPYRPALPLAECLACLRAEADAGGLDADLVRHFCEPRPVPVGRRGVEFGPATT
jgi:putative two-component system response regulator